MGGGGVSVKMVINGRRVQATGRWASKRRVSQWEEGGAVGRGRRVGLWDEGRSVGGW